MHSRAILFLLYTSRQFITAISGISPSSMQTGRWSSSFSSSKDFNCNDEQGFFPARHHCNKYYVCDPWVKLGVLKTCPQGTLFDPLENKCQKSTNVQCNQDYVCSDRRNRPDDKGNNRTFISCKSRFHPRRIKCQPEGTVYDARFNMCIWPEFLTMPTEPSASLESITEVVSDFDATDHAAEKSAENVSTDGPPLKIHTEVTDNICTPSITDLVMTVLLMVSIGFLIVMIATMCCLIRVYRTHLKLEQGQAQVDTVRTASFQMLADQRHNSDRAIILSDLQSAQYYNAIAPQGSTFFPTNTLYSNQHV